MTFPTTDSTMNWPLETDYRIDFATMHAPRFRLKWVVSRSGGSNHSVIEVAHGWDGSERRGLLLFFMDLPLCLLDPS